MSDPNLEAALERLDEAREQIRSAFNQALADMPPEALEEAARQHGCALVSVRLERAHNERAQKPLSESDLQDLEHHGDAIQNTILRLHTKPEAGGLDLTNPRDIDETMRLFVAAKHDWPRMVATIRRLREQLAEQEREVENLQNQLLRSTT